MYLKYVYFILSTNPLTFTLILVSLETYWYILQLNFYLEYFFIVHRTFVYIRPFNKDNVISV